MTKKICVVTGGNSGLGKESSILLQKSGFQVYAGDIVEEDNECLSSIGVTPIFLDVSDNKSVSDAIRNIVNTEGRIDVLVNCAGVAFYGNIEEAPMDDIQKMFDINFWGYVRMIRSVLPTMRLQRKGLIINVSSGSGRYTNPLCGFYCATKYAVESLSDALRQETHSLGISVSIVNPGYFKSKIDKSILSGIFHTRYSADYQALFKGFEFEFPFMWENGMECSDVAKTILEAALADEPKTRYFPSEKVLDTIVKKWNMSDENFDRLVLDEIGCGY